MATMDLYFCNKSLPLIEKKITKNQGIIRFWLIFSIYLLINEFYYASVVLSKNLLIFPGHNFTPQMFSTI